MISVRLGCDIRSGPAGRKNDAKVKATALAWRDRQYPAGWDRVCLVRQHRQILLSDICR